MMTGMTPLAPIQLREVAEDPLETPTMIPTHMGTDTKGTTETKTEVHASKEIPQNSSKETEERPWIS